VLAFPDFDARGPEAPAGDTNAEGARGTPSLDLATMTFRSLPGTAREARAVVGAVGEARVLVGAEATERTFKALHGPRLLHVATHGFFLPDQPARHAPPGARIDAPVGAAMPAFVEDPLLRSGLAFAGANQRKSGADDGMLTAMEVSGADLYGTGLVVLSACETGVGDVVNADGVYGLRRALVLAGARTQVMSLWKVDDAATEELMTGYYRRLQAGDGKGEAMRKVQLAMLAQSDRERPYYWASFVVAGDWKALDGKAVVPEVGRVSPGPRGCACALDAAPEPGSAAWPALLALGLGLARRTSRASSRGRGCQATGTGPGRKKHV
jgi:MYXO-CTERM domain-containing protein